MLDDDYGITKRLDSALEAEARRSLLPFDFATSIAARLEVRRERRFSWFSAVAAIAATVALAIVAVAVPLSFTRPGMTLDPGGSEPTTPQPSVAVSPSPSSTSPSAPPTTNTSPRALTEAEAVEAALRADGRSEMTATHVESGPASEVLPAGFEWAEVPADTTWVWLINLSDGGPPLGAEGSFVVLDYFDGTIYGVQRWIS